MEENRRGVTVWENENEFPACTLNAQMEAQYVTAVMNNVYKKDTLGHPSITVLIHKDGSVSVGFSGKVNEDLSKQVADKLSQLQKRKGKTALNKKYYVSTLEIPREQLDDVRKKDIRNVPALNNCGEPKAMAVAHSNPSEITGIDTVWRGFEPIPHKTDEYKDPRLIYVYPQMTACDQCKNNVTNYFEYAVKKLTEKRR